MFAIHTNGCRLDNRKLQVVAKNLQGFIFVRSFSILSTPHHQKREEATLVNVEKGLNYHHHRPVCHHHHQQGGEGACKGGGGGGGGRNMGQQAHLHTRHCWVGFCLIFFSYDCWVITQNVLLVD